VDSDIAALSKPGYKVLHIPVNMLPENKQNMLLARAAYNEQRRFRDIKPGTDAAQTH
jgi:hypothetical protein